MAPERLKDATLPQALSDVVADLADLFQKELLLAKAEISAKVSTKLNAGAWMLAAAVIAFLAVIALIETIIFAIASSGIAIHWSCLIVAGGLAVIAAIAFAKGRADAQEDLRPDRTIKSSAIYPPRRSS